MQFGNRYDIIKKILSQTAHAPLRNTNMVNVTIGNFNLYEIFFYFFIYAFIGWCAEVIFAAVKSGKFVNRGFLNGPICPVYGAGATAILLALTPLQRGQAWEFLVVFVCSALLCSLLELITGFILEKFFHRKWWDYSDRKFNLFSYICLEMSLVWSFACLLLMYVLQPAVSVILSKIPLKFGNGILIGLAIVFAVDLVFTVLQITSLGKKIKELEIINRKLRIGSDFIGEKLYSATAKSEARLSALKRKIAASRLAKAFPILQKEHTPPQTEIAEEPDSSAEHSETK